MNGIEYVAQLVRRSSLPSDEELRKLFQDLSETGVTEIESWRMLIDAILGVDREYSWLQLASCRAKSAERDVILRLILPNGLLHKAASSEESLLHFGPCCAFDTNSLPVSFLSRANSELRSLFSTRESSTVPGTVLLTSLEYLVISLFSAPIRSESQWNSSSHGISVAGVIHEPLSSTLPSNRALQCYVISKYLAYYFPTQSNADKNIRTFERNEEQQHHQQSPEPNRFDEIARSLITVCILDLWLDSLLVFLNLESTESTTTLQIPNYDIQHTLVDALLTLQLHLNASSLPVSLNISHRYPSNSMGAIRNQSAPNSDTLRDSLQPLITSLTTKLFNSLASSALLNRQSDSIVMNNQMDMLQCGNKDTAYTLGALLQWLALQLSPWSAALSMIVTEGVLPKRRSSSYASVQQALQSSRSFSLFPGRKKWSVDSSGSWGEHVWAHSQLFLNALPCAVLICSAVRFGDWFGDYSESFGDEYENSDNFQRARQAYRAARTGLWSLCAACNGDTLAELIRGMRTNNLSTLSVSQADLERAIVELNLELDDARTKRWHAQFVGFWSSTNSKVSAFSNITNSPDMNALSKCLGTKSVGMLWRHPLLNYFAALFSGRLPSATSLKTKARARFPLKASNQYRIMTRRLEVDAEQITQRREQLKLGKRKCYQLNVQFDQDEWDIPCLSYESEIVLQFAYSLSMGFRNRLGFAPPLRFLSSYFVIFMISFVLMCSVGFRYVL